MYMNLNTKYECICYLVQTLDVSKLVRLPMKDSKLKSYFLRFEVEPSFKGKFKEILLS